MAPKGGNAKKEGGRAKKAENEVCSLSTSTPSVMRTRKFSHSSPDFNERPPIEQGKRKIQMTNEQEKKAAEANKAKDAKEADEWKSGCTPIILGYELMNS
jgi:hypothetical protein